jgi:hypothetical protein
MHFITADAVSMQIKDFKELVKCVVRILTGQEKNQKRRYSQKKMAGAKIKRPDTRP